MTISTCQMSDQTRGALRATDYHALRTQRRRNYATLHATLGDHALFPDRSPDWTPLGFPLLVSDADRLVEQLAQVGIYAPRHWRRLAAPRPSSGEIDCASRLVTLPCDQRYRDADMVWMADVVCRLLR